jgi:hypothetical protein
LIEEMKRAFGWAVARAVLEHQPTKRDHPSAKDARENKNLEHQPTKRDHPSAKDARENKNVEQTPIA